MTTYLLVAASVIVACVFSNKISGRLGIPTLLGFIFLGMVFGTDGIFGISFDNYIFAEDICTVALVFIMFYGGFGTKWSEAKPVAGRAILLSSVGTMATAALVGIFGYFVLKIPLLESFLIGSVISSTDAASVFSILRSRHLNLKYNSASMLELESGSNDPFAYMLTIIILALMEGDMTGGALAYLVFAQLVYGAAFGVGIAYATLAIFKKVKFSSSGFDAIFIFAMALFAFAAPAACGGNGYLSVYLAGLIIGNHKLGNKQTLVNFFDATTGLMQMLLFFLLGLLSFPSRLPEVAFIGLCIALFMTFIARPIAVGAILLPFKSTLRQQLFVSWTGLRGAASIVFAIMTIVRGAELENDIFHIVFFIVLFSILIQGTLIPFFANKLDMTDDESDVMKTFTDYSDEVPVQFMEFKVSSTHKWVGKKISEIVLPPESLLVLLTRGSEKMVPNGKTVLEAGDSLILSGKASGKIEGVRLYEKTIKSNDNLVDKKVADISTTENLIIMIRRDDNIVIPKGDTVLKENDVLVINDASGLQ